MGRVERPRGDLRLVQEPAEQVEASRAVAEVEVEHAGFAGHQPAYVAVGRQPGDLVERRLGRAVVRDRQLAEAQDWLDRGDVGADGAGECRRGQVVAAGPGPGAEALAPEPVDRAEQAGGRPRNVVGAEEADDARDAGHRVVREEGGWRGRLGPRLAAAARHVDVRVDEPGDQPPAAEIDDLDRDACDLRPRLRDRDDSLAGHQHVPPPERGGRVDVGVEEERKPGGRRGGHGFQGDARKLPRP